MRLCYLLEDTSLWGGQKIVFEQAQTLQERGHDVRIITKDKGPDWYDLRVPLIQVEAFSSDSIPQCDFVIGTFWPTVRPAVEAKKGYPVHFCQGYEGDVAGYAPRRHEIEAVYRLPILTLTLHEPLSQLIWQRFGKKAYTVGHGIDHTVFFPEEMRTDPAPWRVLIVGPYEVDWKGVHEALLALQSLKRELPLWVVRASQFPLNEGERNLGVTDEYHCHLRAHEMAALYRSCDIFLAPSWAQEGLGLPLLEALACGLPAAVSDTPTFRAFAEGTDWALFFAERDVRGIQNAVRRLLADPALRTRLHTQGLEVAKEYLFSRAAERIEHILTAEQIEMRTQGNGLTVLLCRTPQTSSSEWVWGRTLCEESFQQTPEDSCPLVVESSSPLTVRDALQATPNSTLGVVLEDVLYWSPVGWETLRQLLVRFPRLGAVGPVSNEASVREQRVAPPFLYHTLSLFRLACREHYRFNQGQWREVPVLDPFAFLVRRAELEILDPQLPLAQVPAALSHKGYTLAVAADTYVHRYAQIYGQPRPDLQECVPREAGRVLDVGCATGAFGAALKVRQSCKVVGIEADSVRAEIAAQRLDRVVQGDIEVMAPSTFAAEFDCIVCGDVIEHLRDPWSVIAKLAAWLRPGGRLIASLPNVGHWSVVADLLQGRWDLVPGSALSWDHIRFFTRAGVERLLRGHGLMLECLQGITQDLAPVGETFIRQAIALTPEVDQEGLRTVAFLAVARKASE